MTDETEPLPPSDPAAAAGATVLTGEQSPAPPDRPAVESTAPHRPPNTKSGEHGAHPTDVQYMLIALFLAVLTGIEVTVSYTKGLGYASNPLLLILAFIKFGIVVAFFMHLRFERPIARRLFIVGIILAVVVYTVVFLTLDVFSGTHGAHR